MDEIPKDDVLESIDRDIVHYETKMQEQIVRADTLRDDLNRIHSKIQQCKEVHANCQRKLAELRERREARLRPTPEAPAS